jgi:release factor glutamine methyltransferase
VTETSIGAWLRTCGLARSDALAIACATLNVSRAWLIAHEGQIVPTAQMEMLNFRAQERKNGVPVAYLLGEKEFYGRMFACSPAALVPRPETELLIERALIAGDALAQPSLRVLDIGTGTGCIAITLECERPTWQIDAIDVSVDALALAARNAQTHNVDAQIRFVQSSWFDALDASERYDLIVSNPPYIARDGAHLTGDGVMHEPRIALTDEADGLTAYKIFARHAFLYLRRNGMLIMEHGYDQAEAIRALFSVSNEWCDFKTHHDLAGLPRVSEVVYRPAAISA